MTIFKRLATYIAVVLLFAVSTPNGIVQAHELKNKNGLSSVLHIAPVDNPKAGEPTKIFVSFADEKNVFNLQNCDCKLGLEQNEKAVQTVPLLPTIPGATVEALASLTFPQVGEYRVVVEGTARDQAFASFRLEYPVRVATAIDGASLPAKSVAQAQSGLIVLTLAAGSLAVLAMIAFISITYRGRYMSVARPVKTKKTSAGSEQKRN